MEPRIHHLAVPNTVGSEGTHDITFYDWGNPDALKVVVCVHGLTRNARDFDQIAQALAARGRRVLALNMAGRGESAWLADPMGYNYGSYVADCIAVLDNFHMRSVDWIGTSMGGLIGMMIASSTDRINKLVMNDIGSRLSTAALKRIFEYVGSMPHQFASREEADSYLRDIFSQFGITDPAQWAAFVDHSLITRDGQLRYACDPAIAVPLRAASKDFTDIADVNLDALWEEVSLPTLILHGEQSDILTTDTIRLMRATNPRAESVTIPGVGHAPSLMNHHQISTVTNWLAGTATTMLASGL